MAATPPQPYGPIPTDRQLQWHQLETYGFIHFTVNTFTDKEWGFGDESPAIFAPSAFDAEQIVRTFKEAGLKGLILTCKHHDGFCLWPSQYTEHSVRNSPWKEGKGDMVREIADACHRHDVKFGVYLSPWDRNHKDYGRPEYITYYRNQLRELLTNYGPVFEVWFDGANGGDGYYGGARETRRIDNRTYYDWENTWQIVRELQPDACMFSDGGPDVRWVGNESGFAGDPCWSTINAADLMPGQAEQAHLNRGDRNGTHWLPAEVDVSIRPGWFYHATEDDDVRSAANLCRIYLQSVGRGANLLLNMPPDRRGLIHENDVRSLREWRHILNTTFAENLARGATATASHTRGNDQQFAPQYVLDAQLDTYWATDDSQTTAELVLDFAAPVTFNLVRIREYLPLGQRVDRFALDSWQDEQWQEFATAENIGSQRLVNSAGITSTRIRLRIVQAAACPAIAELALFQMPVPLEEPQIKRDKAGLVTLTTQDPSLLIRYTQDGAEPTAASTLYDQPFLLLRGGTIKARGFTDQGQHSATATKTFEVSKSQWKVVDAGSSHPDTPPEHAINDNPRTLWSTTSQSSRQGLPQEIAVDMGEMLTLKGFTLLPRQDGRVEGTPDRYVFSVSLDGQTWDTIVEAGEFSNIKANPVLQTVLFSQPVTSKYFRLSLTHTIDDSHDVALAEIGVITK
jgi:alpha-L-fucosidase